MAQSTNGNKEADKSFWPLGGTPRRILPVSCCLWPTTVAPMTPNTQQSHSV